MYTNPNIQALVKLRDLLCNPELYGGLYEYRLGDALQYFNCLGPIDDSLSDTDQVSCIRCTAELLHQKGGGSVGDVEGITGASKVDGDFQVPTGIKNFSKIG